MSKRIYYAAISGFINGAVRAKGDTVGPLSESEAKYLLLSKLITVENPNAKAKPPSRRPEPSPTTLGKKTRG